MKRIKLPRNQSTALNDSGVILMNSGSKGKGAYATKIFKKGEKVLEFMGEIVTYDQLPEDENDPTKPSRYMQISSDLYQGSTDNAESFTNHSCDPNCGVIINGLRAFLIAIKDISPGEEITWDYSSTIDEDDWSMNCLCGSEKCRKSIGSLKLVPKTVQRRYIKLGIVPDYIIQSIIKYDIQRKGKYRLATSV